MPALTPTTLLFPGIDPRVPIPAIDVEFSGEGIVRQQLQQLWKAYGAAIALGWPQQAMVRVEIQHPDQPGVMAMGFRGMAGMDIVGLMEPGPGHARLELIVPQDQGWATLKSRLEREPWLGPIAVHSDTGDPAPMLTVEAATLPVWPPEVARRMLRPWLSHHAPTMRHWAIQQLGQLELSPDVAPPNRRGR